LVSHRLTDDQALPRRFHGLARNGRKPFDANYTLGLSKKAIQKAEVPACDADNRRDGFVVGL
jgi:hypothetical protein